MEREPQPRPPKLIDVVRRDYPTASEVLVSFPDQWEFVQAMRQEERLLYVGAFPLERARPSRDHFHGLAPEINVSLVFYRLYKFFEPWPMPTVLVDWDERLGRGRVTGIGETKVQLQPVGQAQVWFGLSHAVVWEAYIHEMRRRGNWQETLAEVWQAVERDLKVGKVFTPPYEPTFAEGYTEFLSRLGYSLDPDNPDWWSKEIQPT